VYAISGNHEYYGENPYIAEEYLKSAGITFLRDSTILINNSFYLVGRDDRTNHKRKEIAQLILISTTASRLLCLTISPII
jgi:hypothetical protein